MRQKIIAVYVLIFLVLLIILSYYFLYNIYDNEIRRQPVNLYADLSSEMTIEVVPINAIGWRAILRSSSAKFDIIDGKDLIEVVETKETEGTIRIRSKGKTGTVGIKIKSQNSLFPDYVEFQILPLIV
jgi:hypothetical protein